ncbi:putative plant SNARE 11 [Castanea sativa]|uniref:putative plant SNARE 11 n=1 Tax=Castanea sativa TaxID=21020 RepID=UPI003F6504BB
MAVGFNVASTSYKNGMVGEIAGSNVDGLIKEFDRQAKDLESRNDPDANEMLNQWCVIKELNSYVAIKKQNSYNSLYQLKRCELYMPHSENSYNSLYQLKRCQLPMPHSEVGLGSYFSVVVFDEMYITDEVTVDGCYLLVQTVQDTINVGTETAAALKDQVATDRCIMALLFLIIAVGVIAIIIVKLVNPNNKDIGDIPGFAPPAMGWKLLWSAC